MARASRSSKKLPAFDPSELSDLIFSPAVGRGVGSHLLETVEPASDSVSPSLPISDLTGCKDSLEVTTVDTLSLTTGDSINMSTVVESQSSTVVMSSLPAQAKITSSLPSALEKTTPIETQERVTVNPQPIQRDVSTVERLTLAGLSSQGQQNDLTLEDLSTVDMNPYCGHEEKQIVNLPTVDMSDLSSGGMFQLRPRSWRAQTHIQKVRDEVNKASRAETVSKHDLNLSTVDSPSPSTAGNVVPTASTARRTLKIWVTEQGELVPQGRVKRIGPAQDVLNSAEESVYDTLWVAKSVITSGDEHSRTVQAGYHYLAKKTRLSKKTIQRIVDKLIQKGFIEIEQQADIYARTSTIYRVFSYSAVKEHQRRRNRFYVAKIGPGFTYAYEQTPEDLPTVDMSLETTVGRSVMTTEDRPTTVTVVPQNLSTVVRLTTTEVGRNVLVKTTLSGIHNALNEYGQADDDAVHRLVQRCKQIAADCTEEEIVHFVHQKGALIRGKGSDIYSPIGFLVTAVPKCLAGESFRFYREEQQKRREAEEGAERQRQRELEEWRREQEERLADPSVPEEEKRLIRECLGL